MPSVQKNFCIERVYLMSVKSNYIYNTINRILRILIAVITTPYITRVLGSDGIGIYSYTYTIASYFVLFVLLGLDNYGNREIAKSKNNTDDLDNTFSEIYSMQLLFGVVVSIVFLIFSFTNNGKYGLYLRLQYIYVLSSLIDVNWALSGLEEFKFTSIRNIIFNSLGLFLTLVLVRDRDSLVTYTLLLLVLAVVTNLTGFIYVTKRVKFRICFFKRIKKHIKPNLILFIPIIAVSLYKMMDKIMMGMMAEINQVGFYESAEKVIQIPTLLISSLGTVMLPRMTFLYSSGKNDDASKYMKKSIDAAMIISTSLCFGIMGISQEFVPLYYGEGFSLCATLYLILLPCCIFLNFSNVIRTQFLIPKAKDKIYITAVISGAAVNIIVNALLIPKFGAIGAAVGTFIAEIIVCTTQTISVRKDLPIKNYLARSFPFLILGMLMFCVIFFIRFDIPVLLLLVIKVIIGGLLYLIGLVFILKVFHRTYEYDLEIFLKNKH